jgi:hypothetical protein
MRLYVLQGRAVNHATDAQSLYEYVSWVLEPCKRYHIAHLLLAARRRLNVDQNYTPAAASNHGIHKYTWQDLGPRAIALPRSIVPRMQ